MKRLLGTFMAGIALAACSAGQAPGSVTGPDGQGGKSTTGGAGGTKGGSGGSAAGPQTGGASGAGGTGGSGGSSASGGTGGGSSGSGGSSGQIGAVGCTEAALGAPVLRLLTRREFESTIGEIFPGIQGQWTSSLPANLVNDFGFENDSGNLVGKQFADELTTTAIAIGTAITGDALASLLPCSSAGADRACAQTFLDQYGQRLFRRPLTTAEAGRYLALFDTGLAAADFKTALKYVAAGLIESPNAVYRSEVGVVQDDGTRQLTGREVATELAYTFSGTTPSEALLEQFANDPNADPVAAATALLGQTSGKDVVKRFFEAYLGSAGIASTVRNVPAGARPFTEVAPAMVEETRNFIEDVVFTNGLGLRDLLTADFTTPSKTLAEFYGFPAPAADYGRVTRPAARGIGILAQGSFLASHANAEASSPTLRGLFPYYRLLCQPKKTPPKGVPMINTAEVTKTTRERYEVAHMKQGSGCAGCHLFFDPIGFGFEHFDQVGVYRAQQNGVDVNAASNVPDPESGEPLFEFSGQEELARGLAELKGSYECFSAYMATYAFGSADACLGSSQVEELYADSMGIAEAFAKLAGEKHFSRRNAQ